MIKRKNAFTLIEILVVVVVVGILASLAVTHYTVYVEKGRTAEARNLLGQIRLAMEAYYQDHRTTTLNLFDLGLMLPNSCNASFFYAYSSDPSPAGVAWRVYATRCTAGGKSPNHDESYTIEISSNGSMEGTMGYI